MKTLNLSIGLAILAMLCSCATSRYHSEETRLDGTKKIVDWNGNSLFSNSTLKGLTVDGQTKTTTNGLKIIGASTEPNPESITASGSALGELIGTAAKTAAKP